ncbi:MAG TPA: SusD/RagB family nutrient-binding outer membrane lipoprotein [Candidatus Rikenella faecigallinarum]|uniref:SusD/RagB family nutrient-binding outer membrane lipoprotein n=1 Tax=Candidatus Rikenella faecigallinarum TaxID=2838745 RepID=A0A9D1TXI9_9BACT|nr:SusD/RagB family nutrient-binding outer membrane lipoprotein [Candidatus Rikenella faecigallinarum]
MKITKYLIGGLAALALVGCKDKMRELNTNPNTIGSTDPRYMFMSAMQDFDYNDRGYMQDNFGSTGVMMQYFVSYTGATDGTYCNVQGLSYAAPGTIGYNYNWLYGVGYKMASLQNYIDDNLSETEALQYQDLRAIAGIVKVYEAFRVFQNYGAAVYSQAFKAITDGIVKPEYDVFDNSVYESLDDELAGYISVLEAEKNENTSELGIYDPIYGYKANVSGAPSPLGNYDDQRTLWKKFGNSYRLYMAWIMKDVDPTRFSKVLTETKTSGWFESASDGAFAYMNGYNQNGSIYNSDGPNAISTSYSLTDNFVSYLKELKDPRLPLLARNNGLYADNKDLQWIQHYFPDSLKMGAVYDEAIKDWIENVSWNGVLDYQNDPKVAYQGQIPNPNDYDQGGAGEFWGQRSYTFRFYHPDYIPGNQEANEKLEPWTVTNEGTVSDEFPATYIIEDAVKSITIEMASRPQGRYFVACGGKEYADLGTNGANGYDGPVNQEDKYYRRPVFTYPEFCFMMAYLTVEGENTGNTAAQWYANGVTAAMEELQADAIRYEVQVATNTEATKIVGVNDQGLYDISGEIATYVANNSLTAAADQREAIVGQAWIYFYNQPQKMWDWWRKTGYPEIKESTSPATRPTGLYWVKPSMRTSGNPLEFPRRGSLPQPNTMNNINYNAARDELMTQPNYGSIYNETTGRIYWDTQGLQ